MIDFLILLALTSLALCKEDLFCWHKENLCQWALTEEHAVEIHEDETGIWPDSDKMNDIYIYAFLSKDTQKTWNIF